MGAGTWGTALANMLASGGNDVTLWSALPSEIEVMSETHIHPKLEGVVLSDLIKYETDMKKAVQGSGIVILSVPSPYVRLTARALSACLGDETVIIVDVAKGLEKGTHKTLTEVIRDEIPNEKISLVALSGPTHAEEVAVCLPTLIVAASENAEAAERIQREFSNGYFRVYTNSDVKGIELCGALKNIIALAAGISSGLGYGDNARAAVITRGMAEITRLGVKLGCSHRTFESLAGIGDLVVTCTSAHSRNNRAGYLIGKGLSAEDAVREVGMVVEGLNALPAAMELSEKYDAELPICSVVDRIVKGSISPAEALECLMLRDLKAEI